MALAIDTGLLFRAKRNLQIAADAAAEAAALDYYYYPTGGTGTASGVGRSTATQSGYTDGVAGDSVSIGPPWDGPFVGYAGYFEAVITRPVNTTFMGIFNHNTVNVSVRAVAGASKPSDTCLQINNSTGNLGKGTSTAYFQGSFRLNSTHCGITINGTSPDALYFNNATKSPDGLFAESVSVVGGCGGNFCSDSSVPVVGGVAPSTSPFQSIVMPDVSTASCARPTPTVTHKIQGTTYYTLAANAPPGCYVGPVEITNSLLAGLYIFTSKASIAGSTGDVMITGNVTAPATTIDLNDGGLSQAANSSLTITASTGGTYKGFAFIAPASNTSTVGLEFGNTGGQGTVNGMIDMPSIHLMLYDSGGGASACDVMTSDVVVGTFEDKTGCLTITDWSEVNGGPLKAIALVE